jgi:hypothetical protein
MGVQELGQIHQFKDEKLNLMHHICIEPYGFMNSTFLRGCTL